MTSLSDHPGGENVGFADGSVKFIRGSINGSACRALGTVHWGEILSVDDY